MAYARAHIIRTLNALIVNAHEQTSKYTARIP